MIPQSMGMTTLFGIHLMMSPPAPAPSKGSEYGSPESSHGLIVRVLVRVGSIFLEFELSRLIQRAGIQISANYKAIILLCLYCT